MLVLKKLTGILPFLMCGLVIIFLMLKLLKRSPQIRNQTVVFEVEASKILKRKKKLLLKIGFNIFCLFPKLPSPLA